MVLADLPLSLLLLDALNQFLGIDAQVLGRCHIGSVSCGYLHDGLNRGLSQGLQQNFLDHGLHSARVGTQTARMRSATPNKSRARWS
jgi:hypothetical protein